MMNLLTGLWNWVDERLPVQRAWDTHMGQYHAPKNFNFWYFFGVLSLLVLVNQLLTGIWLTMSYTPSAEEAFKSVEYIMRDVDYGWILRYMHSTGASAFFLVIYMHMFRGLIYGSYQKPRELIWVFGMFIFLVLMMEAFVGYVLPWGQMSYWGAQVIINLFGAIPVVGNDIVQWIRGDYLISGITLNRFFALHVVALPIVLLALVLLHILALHEVGSNNPDGVEIKKHKDENGVPLDSVPFFPYYLPVHDLQAVIIFLFVFCGAIFFLPEMGGFFLEPPNFEIANGLKTPEHIAPVWYFTPFYSVLRAIPDKFWGFVAFGASVAILFVIPWLDRSPVKSIRYRGWMSKLAIMLFVVAFLILGVLGVKAPTPERTLLAQICTVIYFGFFLLMPVWTSIEKNKPVPDRITMDGGIGTFKTIGLFILVFVLAWLPLKAAGAAGGCGTLDQCDSIDLDLGDKASLQRGAKTYMNYCYGCHALQYARFGRTADDLGIPEDLMMANLVFLPGAKIGSLMENAMDDTDAKKWFGAAPPDLTLVARARNPEWLYTYLRNFYRDDSRPYGYNNRVFPDVGMPHVLADLQGVAECAPGSVKAENGGILRDPVTGEDVVLDESGKPFKPCGSLVVKQEGQLSPEEYDQTIYDLVNFLEYMGEPIQEKRKKIGVYTMFFLAIFFIFGWLLNREYWKDIH